MRIAVAIWYCLFKYLEVSFKTTKTTTPKLECKLFELLNRIQQLSNILFIKIDVDKGMQNKREMCVLQLRRANNR